MPNYVTPYPPQFGSFYFIILQFAILNFSFTLFSAFSIWCYKQINLSFATIMMKESWKLLFPEHNHKNRKSHRSGELTLKG
jgi:hypothetical protein